VLLLLQLQKLPLVLRLLLLLPMMIMIMSATDALSLQVDAFVPYRNSVLTWLLKESLGEVPLSLPPSLSLLLCIFR
jgi:hypothetical protein